MLDAVKVVESSSSESQDCAAPDAAFKIAQQILPNASFTSLMASFASICMEIKPSVGCRSLPSTATTKTVWTVLHHSAILA